jgi:hypothetical protein
MVSLLPNPANHKRIRLGSSFIYSRALKLPATVVQNTTVALKDTHGFAVLTTVLSGKESLS